MIAFHVLFYSCLLLSQLYTWHFIMWFVFFIFNVSLYVFLLSKLDQSVDFKEVTAKEKLSSYKVGEEITCFVSKVS